ncbi:MAG: tol-pal system YbgF family protein, partial [Promethearchaeota archaeon]
RAAQIASEASPPLNSIIGISFAYIALAYGKKEETAVALEHINTATEFFPMNTGNPLIYAQLLLGLGIEFQKIELHECSIIILKNALALAKSKTAKVDIEVISIVARNLAFSYNKIGNNVASAKLYRIAADLEDEPQSAVVLYRNSAYLYYQENMKEFTLDILQTAFDKSGILGDTECQLEIAHFQGLVSYEIGANYIQRGSLERAIAYLDLCYEKFTLTEDSLWVIRALYEKAIILERLGKDWQRNKVLEKLLKFEITDKNKEYIVKAILLLIIHALEGDHYSKAEFYIQQVTEAQLRDIKPQLSQKIQEIRDILDISHRRGQLHADLHFTRKDLDLPIDELLPEVKIPAQDILLAEDKFASLQVPELDIGSKPPPSHKIKQPTIEVLQELFNIPEEIQPVVADQEPLSLITQDHISVEEPQEPDVVTSSETSRYTQEKTVALDRLFRAHQIIEESSVSALHSEQLTFAQNTEIDYSFSGEPTDEHIEDSSLLTSSPVIVSQDENIRSEVVSRLQRAGWAVELNFTNLTRRGSEPDVIATKGLIRKNRKFIFFAENPADAEICSFLLQSNPERGEKLVFLLSGDPRDANVSVMVKLVTQIGQLF